MFEILLPFIFIIFLGYIAKDRFFKKEEKEVFSKFVFNFSLPALIFSSLYGNSPQGDFWRISLGVWITGILISLIALFLGKLLRLSKPTLGSFFLISFCGNVTYMGYPIIEKVFSPEGLSVGIVYDQLGLIPLIYTYAIIMVQYITSEEGVKWDLALKRLFINPPLWALILAFILRNIPLPSFLIEGTKTLGRVTSPLMMFLLGLSLEKSGKNNLYIPLFIGIFLKLFLLPLSSYFLNPILGIKGLSSSVMLLQSAMPSMLLTLVLALQFNLDYSFTSQVIFYSTLLSLITLNLWIGVIK